MLSGDLDGKEVHKRGDIRICMAASIEEPGGLKFMGSQRVRHD